MSTRIHGYRFPTIQMSDLPTYLYDIRQKVVQTATQLARTWFTQELIQALDHHAITGAWPQNVQKYATKHYNELYFVMKEKIRRNIVDAWNIRDLRPELLEYDLTAGLTLFFDDRWIYAIPEFQQSEIGMILTSAPGMEDYSYDTSVDDLPEEEAAERGEKWDSLIGRVGVISYRGIRYEAVTLRTLRTEIQFPSVNEILTSLPDPMVRAEAFAKDVVVTARANNYPPAEFYRLVAVLTKAREWVEGTAEGREAWAVETRRIAALLKPTFTIYDFLVKLPVDIGGNHEKSGPTD